MPEILTSAPWRPMVRARRAPWARSHERPSTVRMEGPTVRPRVYVAGRPWAGPFLLPPGHPTHLARTASNPVISNSRRATGLGRRTVRVAPSDRARVCASKIDCRPAESMNVMPVTIDHQIAHAIAQQHVGGVVQPRRVDLVQLASYPDQPVLAVDLHVEVHQPTGFHGGICRHPGSRGAHGDRTLPRPSAAITWCRGANPWPFWGRLRNHARSETTSSRREPQGQRLALPSTRLRHPPPG